MRIGPYSALVLLVATLSGRAEARSEIAIFESDDLPAYQAPAEAFRLALGLPVTVHAFDGDRGQADEVAAALRDDPPPLIFALGAKAAWTAVRNFPEVPVVYAMVLDPARYGIGGPRVTGVAMSLPLDLMLAQYKLFLPDMDALGLIVTSVGTSSATPAIEAATRSNLRIVTQEADTPRELRRAVSQLSHEVDALWLLPDPELLTPSNFRILQDAALRARLPMLGSSDAIVRAGALLCVNPSYQEVGREAARLARNILNAEADAPLPQPTVPQTPRVVLNRDTLDALGRKIDPVLYDFVDEVVDHTPER